MNKHHKEVFNDGYLYYGHKKTTRSANKKSIGSVFTEEGKLAFKEMSARETDYTLAETLGSKLDLKVKTPYPPSFRNIDKDKLKVTIRGNEYDVIKVDPDNVNRFLYFYLQKVGGHHRTVD